MSTFCPYCSAENSNKATECIECGEDLVECSIKRKDLIDNRYEIKHVIKAGAMGCVYKAYDTQMENIVAIKKMLTDTLDDEMKKFTEQKFWDEARLLSELDHIGLPKLRDFFIANDPETGKDAHFMVMSYIEGVDLETYVEKKKLPLPLAEGLNYFRQILNILMYLHMRVPPVIFRDVKPSNIMVHEGRAYLVDFGIAEEYNPRRKSAPVGTSGYSAPEQYKGFPEPRSDLYSLGAVMHYLFTGLDPVDESKQPFVFDTIRKHNPEIPQYVEDILISMLNVMAVKRPDSAKMVLDLIKYEGDLTKAKSTKTKFVKTTPKPEAPKTEPPKEAPRSDLPKPKEMPKPEIQRTAAKAENGKAEQGRVKGKPIIKPSEKTGVKVILEPKPKMAKPDKSASRAKPDSEKLQEKYVSRTPLPTLRSETMTLRSNVDRLFTAVRKNNTAAAKNLLAAGADPNGKDFIGWTPVHKAAALDLREILGLLIEKGGSVNAHDSCSWTPLHRAAARGSLTAALILLERGALVNAVDKFNMTPLHRAVEANRKDMIQLLADKGANLNAENADGWTPLYRAAVLGKKEAVNTLLELGAGADTRSRSGWTPLHEAARADLKDIAELLIQKGADVNAKTPRGISPAIMAKRNQSKNVSALLKE